jgi:hypothetical protein
MVLALLFALPITTIAAAEAAPVTVGDWMRTIFASPDREVDGSQKGLAATPPPAPQPALQTSSEPTPPKEPVARAQLPRLWFSGGRQNGRKRRARRLR